MRETRRLDDIAVSYSAREGFNKHVVEYGFRSLAEYFRGTSCLELGSADGVMTERLAESFDHLTVVEGSQRYAHLIERQLGASHPGLTVVHSLFEEYQPPHPFDTIVAAHILEHVEDPVGVAARARGWLSPGGCLLVLVPNALSFNRLLGVEMGLISRPDELVAGDHAVGHRRVYTPELLVAHMEAASLRVVVQTGVLFKPLSNAQMDAWFTDEMVEGCWQLGKRFPLHAGDILLVCEAG